KVDPRGFTMDSMRSRIKARLAVDPSKPTPPPSTGATYTVKPGDTLSGIAKALGVTVDALFQANRDRIKDKDEIFPGQELVVPKGSGLPKPVKPKVDLSQLIAAARSNPTASGQPITYAGVKTVDAALVNEVPLSKSCPDGQHRTSPGSAYAAWQTRCG